MFWESVGSGLGVLAYWQTYLAGLLFLALSVGPMFLIGAVAMKSGRAEGAIGCLSMLVLPFFQVFALVVFVLTMSPIILGLSQEAAWSFPWSLSGGSLGGSEIRGQVVVGCNRSCFHSNTRPPSVTSHTSIRQSCPRPGHRHDQNG